MGSLFSAISSQFGKPLLFGTLLPVAVAVLLFILLVSPQLPPATALAPLETLGTEWRALVLAIVAIVLTGLLYNLNTPLVRLFEGYFWNGTWLGKRRILHYQSALQILQARRANLLVLLDSLPDDHPLVGKASSRLARVSESLRSDFPTARESVLPTQLGNVIRSFENYSRDQYGISAIPVWPRLVAVLSATYLSALEDAKAGLDFLLNSSLLSGVLAGALLVLGGPGLAVSSPKTLLWLGEVGALAVASWVFYRLSIGQATTWGDLVKGAFDLYRWDLLTKLGYGAKPSTRGAERKLWGEISCQLLFGDKGRDEREPGPWIEKYSEEADPGTWPWWRSFISILGRRT